MTEREALKLALEFIEKMATHHWTANDVAVVCASIREALAQPEQHQDWCASLTQMLASMPPKPAPCNCKTQQLEQEPAPTSDTSEKRVDETAKKRHEAQPEQEPVAWRNAAIRVGEDLCSVGPFGYYDMTAQQWLDWALSVVTVHAPPPQRTWQGLTNEDFLEVCQIAERGNYLVAFQRIQAKLRSKNT